MKDLSAIFGRFAGRELPLLEEQKEVLPGVIVPIYRLRDKNDPLIGEMEAAARQERLSLRLWLPDSMGTADYKPNRVNAYVKKAPDGVFRISSTFSIG